VTVRLHPHAVDRLAERGATEAEVRTTVETGERFAAKFGRIGFRRNFAFGGVWRGRSYASKQIEAYTVEEQDGWLVITLVVKYFAETERAP
jgi:hypothetical protein